MSNPVIKLPFTGAKTPTSQAICGIALAAVLVLGACSDDPEATPAPADVGTVVQDGGSDGTSGADTAQDGGADTSTGADTADTAKADTASTDAGTDTTSGCVPTKDPKEICDGVDNDCDGKTDDKAAQCDDGKACTTDECAGKDGCKATNLATGTCDDGDKCTGDGACKDGVCLPGTATTCDDANVCTGDSCDKATGMCKNATATDGGACDDGNPCMTGEACKTGVCMAGAAMDCDDKNVCTDDMCDIKDGKCKTLNNTRPCTDDNACTISDTCKDAACMPGAATSCDDNNACTDDSCDTKTGKCASANNTKPCTDGDGCTVGDVCKDAACMPGAVTACDDKNACTDDSCDSKTGNCVATNNTKPCDDASKCTLQDACKNGACAGGAAPVCDDSKPCTDNNCDKATGCVYPPNSATCTDGDACSNGDKCGGGVCLPGALTSCNDANPCTNDSCDKIKGCEHAAHSATCDDGNKCTDLDRCDKGMCGGVIDECHDNDKCTKDWCDTASGDCMHEAIAACLATCSTATDCDDGNSCTLDVCDGGKCATDDNALYGTSCGAGMPGFGGKYCDGLGVCTVPPACNTWTVTFGTHQESPAIADSSTELLTSIAPTSDGGGYFAGYARSASGDSYLDATVLRLDGDGKLVSHKRYGHAVQPDAFRVALPDGDDGAWFVGYGVATAATSASDFSGFVVKVDKAGNTKAWNYDAASNDRADYFYAAQLVGNTLFAAGVSDSGGSNGLDPWLAVIGADGKMIAQTVLNLGAEQEVGGIAVDATNSVVYVVGQYKGLGQAWVFGPDGKHAVTVPVGTSGIVLNGAFMLPDGQVAVYGKQGSDALLGVGNPKTGVATTFSLSDKSKEELRGAVLTPGGSIIAVGTTDTQGPYPGVPQGIAMHIGFDGKIDPPVRTYGGPKPGNLYAVAPATGGGWLLAGVTGTGSYPGLTSNDRWAMRVGHLGQQICPDSSAKCTNHNECNDGDECTTDMCEAGGACSHAPVASCK